MTITVRMMISKINAMIKTINIIIIIIIITIIVIIIIFFIIIIIIITTTTSAFFGYPPQLLRSLKASKAHADSGDDLTLELAKK